MTAGALFRSIFGRDPASTLFVSGRVNLIGEHTDYNGGNVMPMALPLGVTVAIAPHSEPRIRVHSSLSASTIELSPDSRPRGHWSDYVLGAVAIASEPRSGYDIAIESTLPAGAGLSSSAAVIVGVIKTVHTIENRPITDIDAAFAAKTVENEYIGVPCGIMDQMAVSLLAPGECMRLDTKSLTYRRMTPPAGWTFVVSHSGVARALTDGRYAERRAECEAAATALGVSLLCDRRSPPPPGALNDVLYRRARHQITENNRVLAAQEALERSDIAAFGRAMNESHASMRDDFEISTLEIDALVENALNAGAVGARMTGGGFGGCIVSLVEERRVSAWREAFSRISAHARHIVDIEGRRTSR